MRAAAAIRGVHRQAYRLAPRALLAANPAKDVVNAVYGVLTWPFRQATKVAVDRELANIDKKLKQFEDDPGFVTVQFLYGPVYGDGNKSLYYAIQSSEFDDYAFLEGPEAEKKLQDYLLWTSLPGEDVIGAPFGTVEEPAVIPSYEKFRIVSCQGKWEEIHEPTHMRLISGQKHLCPVCDQCFLVTRPLTKLTVIPRAAHYLGVIVEEWTRSKQVSFDKFKTLVESSKSMDALESSIVAALAESGHAGLGAEVKKWRETAYKMVNVLNPEKLSSALESAGITNLPPPQ